jgi:hypothetical protein
MGDICLFCRSKKTRRTVTQQAKSTTGLTAVVAAITITIAGNTVMTQKINACFMNYKTNMTYTH